MVSPLVKQHIYLQNIEQDFKEPHNKETGERKANFTRSDEDETTTAAKVTFRINRKAQTAIVDSGAATSIITKALLNCFEYKADRPLKLIVVTTKWYPY